MKVKELIDALSNMDEDAEVFYAYPAGDYWHTTIAGAVQTLDEGYVKHSGYHEKMVVADAEDDAEDEDKAVYAVIIDAY
jgi:hypothetical protein